jgi:hypothetical protein
MSNKRWLKDSEGANRGDFGPDDQPGRLDLIAPDKIRLELAR